MHSLSAGIKANNRTSKHSNIVLNMANTVENQDGTFTVISKTYHHPDIQVTTLNLSWNSDVYTPGHNYAGLILYSHNGETTWRLNGVPCKTGYIVMRDPTSRRVSTHLTKCSNQAHTAVYKSLFGEEVSEYTIAEGFAVIKGEFNWKCGVINARDSPYHTGTGSMSESSKCRVAKVLCQWMEAGLQEKSLPHQKNFQLAIRV